VTHVRAEPLFAKITIHEKVVEKIIIFLDFGGTKIIIFLNFGGTKIIIFFLNFGGGQIIIFFKFRGDQNDYFLKNC